MSHLRLSASSPERQCHHCPLIERRSGFGIKNRNRRMHSFRSCLWPQPARTSHASVLGIENWQVGPTPGRSGRDCSLHRRVHYVLRRTMDGSRRLWLPFVSHPKSRCAECLACKPRRPFQMDGAAIAGNRYRSGHRLTGLMRKLRALNDCCSILQAAR